MLKDLIVKNRSYRRFFQDEQINRQTLLELIDLARLSGSAKNLQPLKYIVSNVAELNAEIFQCLAWAGYLKDWPGPTEGERPSAYIIMLGDTSISKTFGSDQGIASQSILLGATEKGLGGCIIASAQKPKLREILRIPAELEVLLVIALGRPRETVVLEELPPSGDIYYWRDPQGTHHVPKRSLDEIIIG
ncbi:MAG: nitroreductase family protein [Ignavibacteria bacterium]|nr:nitroreductase family protein [Ignavibacteria bacterium]MCU7504949.1 nitroreductase family protein [Ignavibacteria bacterium]MCU7514917.1 nitroreductase family protein [Ignavibacteria bacterium]